jgi:hypothetical protein
MISAICGNIRSASKASSPFAKRSCTRFALVGLVHHRPKRSLNRLTTLNPGPYHTLIRDRLRYCAAQHPKREAGVALRKDYQPVYFFILDNRLNQPAPGHILLIKKVIGIALANWIWGTKGDVFFDSRVSKTSFTQRNDATLGRLEVPPFVWRLSTEAPRK